MPQVFIVVRCYSCNVFQVQQVKKVPKWVCKMCGEKQSLKKEYGRGSGADCRGHVQKLNMLKASTEDVIPHGHGEYPDNEYAVLSETENPYGDDIQDPLQDGQFANDELPSTASMWSQFFDDTDVPPEVDDDETHPSGAFDASKITTDRDAVKSRRGRRGGKRGNGNSYGGRKRKYYQDELEDNHQDYKKQSFQNNHNISNYSRSGHPYSTSEEPWMERSSCVNDQTSDPPCSNFSNVGKSLSKSAPSGHSSSEKPMQVHSRSTVQKTNSFPKKATKVSTNRNSRWGQFMMSETEPDQNNDEQSQFGSRDLAEKTESLAKQTSTVSTCVDSSSKWGQFLEDDKDTEESCEDSLQYDGSLSSPYHQHQSIGHCSQVGLTDSSTTVRGDEVLHSEVEQGFCASTAGGKLAAHPFSNKRGYGDGILHNDIGQNADTTYIGRKLVDHHSPEHDCHLDQDSSEGQKLHSLHSSSRWNAFVSNKSYNGGSNINQSHKYKKNQNLALSRKSTQNTYQGSPIEGKQNLLKSCTMSTDRHQKQDTSSSGAAEIQQKKTSKNIFSIEDHQLDELFSDDW